MATAAEMGDGGGNEMTSHAGMTGDDLRKIAFAPSRAFAKGYDVAEVHAFVESSALLVDQLHVRYLAQIERLRYTIARTSDQSEHARSLRVLTAADQTARSVVTQAEEHAERSKAEAASAHAEARRKSEALLREATEYSELVVAEAGDRAAALEKEAQDRARVIRQEADDRARMVRQEADDRVRDIHEAADRAQSELNAQIAALQTLRESARLQMQGFLADLFTRVSSAQDAGGVGTGSTIGTDGSGRSLPSRMDLYPSGGGTTREPPASPIRQSKTAKATKTAKRRSRRPPRVAGQSTEPLLPAQRAGN